MMGFREIDAVFSTYVVKGGMGCAFPIIYRYCELGAIRRRSQLSLTGVVACVVSLTISCIFYCSA